MKCTASLISLSTLFVRITVSQLCHYSQDAPVQTHVREALTRPRMAHALRPSAGSSQRIVGDLRSAKWSTRREERYRILSSHRAGLPAEQPPSTQPEPTEEEPGKNAWSLGEVQVFDIIQEDGDQDKASSKVSVSRAP